MWSASPTIIHASVLVLFISIHLIQRRHSKHWLYFTRATEALFKTNLFKHSSKFRINEKIWKEQLKPDVLALGGSLCKDFLFSNTSTQYSTIQYQQNVRGTNHSRSNRALEHWNYRKWHTPCCFPRTFRTCSGLMPLLMPACYEINFKSGLGHYTLFDLFNSKTLSCWPITHIWSNYY